MSRPLLTAAMIVRDEQDLLPACLASLHGLVDELVVVDTGSTDATVRIARGQDAVVLHHNWNGSFADARNTGLAQARGEWILYIDADERVRPLPRERLLARLSCASEIALRVSLRPFTGATPYLEYRLWRNDPRIRFHGVMHERVVDSIHEVAIHDGRPISDWPELALDHVGYDDDQTRKHLRNLPLLDEQLRREPSNIFNWRHLARVLRALGRAEDATRALERAVELARAEARPTRDGSLAWADLVRLRHDEGADVEDLLREGRDRWPDQWLLRWIEGQVALERGDAVAAERHFRELLAVDVDTLPGTGIAYDERIFGEFASASLGLALFRQRRFDESAAAYAQAERLAPEQPEYRIKRLLAEARRE
jgi:glycosyltransferase involved in cell wall biosynthesis